MPPRPAAVLAVSLALGACTPAATAPQATGLAVPADAQEAVVVRVSDGDTVVLRGRGTGPLPGEATKVRVLLVDTPEVHSQQECFGAEATARTEQLLAKGSTVRVQADVDEQDRFGRTLLHVWTEAGDNLGEVLLAEGYATVQQVGPNRRYEDAFRDAEDRARAAGRGLWDACAG